MVSGETKPRGGGSTSRGNCSTIRVQMVKIDHLVAQLDEQAGRGGFRHVYSVRLEGRHERFDIPSDVVVQR